MNDDSSGQTSQPDHTALASARKLAAKRFNERLKLFASFLNALAIGVVGTAIVIPVIQQAETMVQLQRAAWFFLGLCRHLCAQSVFSGMRSED